MTHKMPPHRLQRQTEAYQRAYRDWQAPPLRPTARPPGLFPAPYSDEDSRQSIWDVVGDENRRRQALQVRELWRMNDAASQSKLNNGAVLRAGAMRNALGGLLPVVIANEQNRRQRRGRR